MNGKVMSLKDVFQKRVTEHDYWDVSQAICLDTERFRHKFEGDPANQDLEDRDRHRSIELDVWAQSGQAKALLRDVVKDSLDFLKSYEGQGTPAHDLRHILFKDITEALRFKEEDKVKGYRRWFLVASLWHDAGRLIEGAFDSLNIQPDKKIDHSVFSYALCKEFLEPYNIPVPLKDHILYAVLGHSGVNTHTFIGRATQRADRLQTVGTEGYLRALAHDMGVSGLDLKTHIDERFKKTLPAFRQNKSVFHLSEYLLRNMFENIGNHIQRRERFLKTISAALLHASSCDELRAQLFYPELHLYEHGQEIKGRLENKELLDLPVWRDAYTLSMTWEKQAGSVVPTKEMLLDQIVKALSGPGNITLDEHYISVFKDKIEVLNEQERLRLSQGLGLAKKWQKLLDQDDQAFLKEILSQKGAESPEGLIAKAALDVSGYSPENFHVLPTNNNNPILKESCAASMLLSHAL